MIEPLTLAALCAALYKLNSQSRELARARSEARTDSLTEIGNRLLWDETIRESIDLGMPFGFIVLDVANLKAANAVLGHANADDMLQRIASQLRTDEVIAARTGGDEFAVLIANPNEVEAARDRIEERVGIQWVSERAPVFIAGGVGRWEPGADLRELVLAADREAEARKAAKKEALGASWTREQILAPM
jgi:diguanylate cyclase (GGDEF)-like protein